MEFWQFHPTGVLHAGVVGQRGHAMGLQLLGDLLDALARLAVDDAGLAFVLALDEAQQLLHGIGLLDNGVADVGPVKAANELARVLQLQALDHVLAGQRVGGGRQRHTRHVRKLLVQQRQRAVLGPEVVAPLADAVRLVDGKETEQAALVQRGQQAAHARCVDALGRCIQQRELGAQEPTLELAAFLGRERGVQEGGLDASLVKRADLVVHERDQR